MDITVNKDTRVVCSKHDYEFLKASFRIDLNRIVIEPCKWCLQDAVTEHLNELNKNKKA